MHFKTLLGQIILVLGRGTIRRFAASSIAVTASEIGTERKVDASSREKLATHGCGQQPKVWRYKNQHEHIRGTCPCLPVIETRDMRLSSPLVFIFHVSLCLLRAVVRVRWNAKELSSGTCHFEPSRVLVSSVGENGVGLFILSNTHEGQIMYTFWTSKGKIPFSFRGFVP